MAINQKKKFKTVIQEINHRNKLQQSNNITPATPTPEFTTQYQAKVLEGIINQARQDLQQLYNAQQGQFTTGPNQPFPQGTFPNMPPVPPFIPPFIPPFVPPFMPIVQPQAQVEQPNTVKTINNSFKTDKVGKHKHKYKEDTEVVLNTQPGMSHTLTKAVHPYDEVKQLFAEYLHVSMKHVDTIIRLQFILMDFFKLRIHINWENKHIYTLSEGLLVLFTMPSMIRDEHIRESLVRARNAFLSENAGLLNSFVNSVFLKQDEFEDNFRPFADFVKSSKGLYTQLSETEYNANIQARINKSKTKPESVETMEAQKPPIKSYKQMLFYYGAHKVKEHSTNMTPVRTCAKTARWEVL